MGRIFDGAMSWVACIYFKYEEMREIICKGFAQIGDLFLFSARLKSCSFKMDERVVLSQV